MRMHTHGHQTMVTESSKTTNFWAHFFYNMFLYWLTIPFIGITFFYSQVYFRKVKAIYKTTTLLACFFYNTIFHWLTNIAMGKTFLKWQVLFLMKDFMQKICLFGYALFLLIWLLVVQSDIQKLVTYTTRVWKWCYRMR